MQGLSEQQLCIREPNDCRGLGILCVETIV